LLRRIVVAVCLLVAAVPVLEGVAPAAGPFAAGGSVNQVYVTGLTPGDEVELLDADDDEVASGVADGAGALLFREIQAGSGYQVRSDGTTVGGLAVTDPDDHPDPAWYDTEAAAHPIAAGYGYLTTRDGTKLSVNVNFPDRRRYRSVAGGRQLLRLRAPPSLATRRRSRCCTWPRATWWWA
jgi:hypothetical protein